MALFCVSVSGVLAFVYYTTEQVIVRQTDETIQAEILGLTEHYRDEGLTGLLQIIRQRSAGASGKRGLYLLADQKFHPLAGNLQHWPDSPVARNGSAWIDFLVRSEEQGAGAPQVARARIFDLPGGFHLLIGRDMTERGQFQAVMAEALLGALGVAIFLGLVGGVLMSRDLLRRLDAINRSTRAIIRGDMRERMPVTGSDDEFDQLSTNLNLMLDRIHELMQGIRQVTDNIAHDLRSPINRVRSRMEMTLLGQPDVATCREAMQDTIDEADAILGTFNALLDIALAESGAPREQFETIDLAQVASDAKDLYEPLAEDRGLRFDSEIASGLEIRGNRHLVSQALSNLLENAIKYTPEGGRIGLYGHQGEAGPVLEIADSGPGIPEDSRDTVLARFARLDESRATPGSGLGLSLVAAVARLHKADLRLEDNEPGLRVILQFDAAGSTGGKGLESGTRDEATAKSESTRKSGPIAATFFAQRATV